MKATIKKWLGIKKLENENQVLINKYSSLSHLYRELKIENSEISKDNKNLMSLLDLGTDIHFKERSWAVVCLHGKHDYINFMELPESNIGEIKSFLRQFKRSNNVIDAPHPMRAEFRQFNGF